MELLNENLRQPHSSVQLAAAAALRVFLFVYFGSGAAPTERWATDIVIYSSMYMHVQGFICWRKGGRCSGHPISGDAFDTWDNAVRTRVEV